MKKFFLINGVLFAILMSGCYIPGRLYQQQPPANLNVGSGQNITADPNGGTDQNLSDDLNGGLNQDIPTDTEVGIDEEYEEITVEGAYIENVASGYISTKPGPESDTIYLVETEYDIKAAERAVGMAIPEDDPDWEWMYNTTHIDAFQEMIEKYPIDEYSYIFQYQEYPCLGYRTHADAVVYKGEYLYFHYDVAEGPDEGEATCEAMDGEFKIAAIPKDFFTDKTFSNVLRTYELYDEDIDVPDEDR